MWDDSTLVWLIHSCPRFPPLQEDRYSFPDNAVRCGQTGLCMSLKISDLESVTKQLFLNWPLIYQYKVSHEPNMLINFFCFHLPNNVLRFWNIKPSNKCIMKPWWNYISCLGSTEVQHGNASSSASRKTQKGRPAHIPSGTKLEINKILLLC